MRIPSIEVIVFLLDTVPIAGVSTFIKVDFCTVNFILNSIPSAPMDKTFRFCFLAAMPLSFSLPEAEEQIMVYLVGVVVVGPVEIVEMSSEPLYSVGFEALLFHNFLWLQCGILFIELNTVFHRKITFLCGKPIRRF